MAMISTVTFNGKSLNPKRFRIQHLPDYTIAERDQEQLHVEGRDGDLVLDAKSYKNVPRKYSISFGADGPEDFATAVSEISKWLDCGGYGELEDTYDPEYFWLAVPVGSPKVYSLLNGYMGKVDIEFSCQPRKFLKSGRIPIIKRIVDAEGDITIFRMYNPTEYDVLPLIYVYPMRKDNPGANPSCTIRVAENVGLLNGSTIPETVAIYELVVNLTDRILPTSASEEDAEKLGIVIDCETENAYPVIDPDADGPIKGDVNQDGEVTSDDARMVMKAVMGTLNPPLTPEQIALADMDNNGQITMADVQAILQKSEKEIYKKNLNSVIEVYEKGFPVLQAKKNNVVWFEGDVSKIAIVPRYWTR